MYDNVTGVTWPGDLQDSWSVDEVVEADGGEHECESLTLIRTAIQCIDEDKVDDRAAC